MPAGRRAVARCRCNNRWPPGRCPLSVQQPLAVLPLPVAGATTEKPTCNDHEDAALLKKRPDNHQFLVMNFRPYSVARCMCAQLEICMFLRRAFCFALLPFHKQALFEFVVCLHVCNIAKLYALHCLNIVCCYINDLIPLRVVMLRAMLTEQHCLYNDRQQTVTFLILISFYILYLLSRLRPRILLNLYSEYEVSRITVNLLSKNVLNVCGYPIRIYSVRNFIHSLFVGV